MFANCGVEIFQLGECIFVLALFSYLIVPAACGTYLANSRPARLVVGWCVATLACVGGLYASFKLDVPTGAAIVCALGVSLLIAGAAARLRRAEKFPGPPERNRL